MNESCRLTMTAVLIKKRGNEIAYPNLLLNKNFLSARLQNLETRNKKMKRGGAGVFVLDIILTEFYLPAFSV